MAHWKEYSQKAWEPLTHVPESIPFHGTKQWENLSPSQKEQLALGFIQINAEVIIHLEQGLLLATREMQRRGQRIDEGMKAFVDDEVLHMDMFRAYLKELHPQWPKGSLYLHKNSWTRSVCARIYRWEPLGPFLPGAKSEIYAVQYHVAVRKQSSAHTQWAALVRHHAIDEASHIAKDFELLREALATMSWTRRVKVYVATLLCVLMTQLSLAAPAWRLIAQVFPESTLLKRVKLTVGFARWVLNIHPAFPATRRVFAQTLKRETDPFFKHFAFLGW